MQNRWLYARPQDKIVPLSSSLPLVGVIEMRIC